MENNITSIQGLANFINVLAIKNRKENGIYNVTIASLTGILITELERVNEFFEQEGLISLYAWELLSPNAVNAEIENSHPSLNLKELYKTSEIKPNEN
ncbi:hypothetical protein [Flavobacterium taihuense]|uniref:Uncharacterized protein n=1 Tax=Flavobacterium taihuense TaxID=2857508 RepID=A0ABS6Y2Z5_9FLAO|nr:hypothetical protein [Flavobacterium taihuense]MBW4362449.1 hypothetical protein [Flavobacterium taihuense]